MRIVVFWLMMSCNFVCDKTTVWKIATVKPGFFVINAERLLVLILYFIIVSEDHDMHGVIYVCVFHLSKYSVYFAHTRKKRVLEIQ